MAFSQCTTFKNVDAFDAMNLANVVWSLAVLDHHAFNSSLTRVS